MGCNTGAVDLGDVRFGEISVGSGCSVVGFGTTTSAELFSLDVESWTSLSG
jgi:hypothetical protein